MRNLYHWSGGGRRSHSESVQTQPIQLMAALGTFDDHWNPRIIATVNDYDVRIAKVVGDYVWHKHDDTDEFFQVLDGHLLLDLRDGAAGAERTVSLPKGGVYVVPRGIEHRPRAEVETSLLLLEPTGTRTTGDYAGSVPDHIVSTAGQPLLS
jgi:mannose-6-phosphate isomerase-like protein (cupin superfamily)